MKAIVIGIESADPVIVASEVDDQIVKSMLQISGVLAIPKAQRTGTIILGTASCMMQDAKGDVSSEEFPLTVIAAESIVSAQLVEVVIEDGDIQPVPVALAKEYAKNRRDD